MAEAKETKTAAEIAADPMATAAAEVVVTDPAKPVVGSNEEVKLKSGEFIQAIGPADPSNNAAALRFTPVDTEGNALDTIQIHRGQRLKVGTAKDANLTIEQAKSLMGLRIWTFHKVDSGE